MFLKALEPEKSRKLFRGDGRENIRKIRLAERKSEFSYKAYFLGSVHSRPCMPGMF